MWPSAPWGSAFAFPNAATVRYFAITVHSILAAHLAPATTIKATRTLELMWRRIRLVALASLVGGDEREEQITLIIPCVLVRNAHDTTWGDTCEL